MKPEKRNAIFDPDLEIEAYHFEGIMQKFPNHFHEHYVLGFIESGNRYLICKNKEYTVNQGDLLLFNPLENHTCAQVDDQALDWRSINIEQEVMGRIAAEITGRNHLPIFTSTVVSHSDAVPLLQELHQMILSESKDFKKEETFYFLMEELITSYTRETGRISSQMSNEIQNVCSYMERHYFDPLSLDDLTKLSGMNKYTLLRNFTIQRGITPFQYLSTVRVNNAKNLLDKGISPVEAALQSGFSDQSHFTRFFKNFIGLTPKLYQDVLRDHYDR